MMKNYNFRPVITLLMFVLLTLAGINATSLTQIPSQVRPHSQGTSHIVTRVIDGDTVIIDSEKTIRLIGIDTPERNEEGYGEAKKALEKLINNKSVTIYTDKEILDPYNRTLAYVYHEDLFINLNMIELGWAVTMPIEPNLKHSRILKMAEDAARISKVGRWK